MLYMENEIARRKWMHTLRTITKSFSGLSPQSHLFERCFSLATALH